MIEPALSYLASTWSEKLAELLNAVNERTATVHELLVMLAVIRAHGFQVKRVPKGMHIEALEPPKSKRAQTLFNYRVN